MCDKKKKNKKEKKTKKLSQFLKSHISGTRNAISLKFGMWSAAVGGHFHSKNRLVSSRKHRATEVRKLCFLSSCQYRTVEVSVLGHFQPSSIAAIKDVINFTQQVSLFSKGSARNLLFKCLNFCREYFMVGTQNGNQPGLFLICI